MAMRNLNVILNMLILFIISGCGGAANGPESSNTTYVNAVVGLDQSGYGLTRAEPYKTITYALAQETTKSTVEVANGTYDAANGEQFPITVRPGTKLIGEKINLDLQEYALISGMGDFNSSYVNGVSTVAVVLDDAAEIKNLVINSESGVALWCENANDITSIINNGFINSHVGMTIVGDSAPLLRDNVIKDNLQSGIEIFGNAKPVLLNNNINMNSVGIFINDNAMPNFGGESGGGNIVSDNLLCDLLHSGVEAITTIGTKWDLDVFNFSISSNCTAGNEIVVDGAGSVNYQFIPPQDSLLFQNKSRIRLDQPGFGEVIFTNEPNFVWSDSSAKITMVAVWEQPPTVTLDGVADTGILYWIWHSGLGTGGSGFAQFNDGVLLVDGDFNNTQPPVLLEKGRSYYWAVWGWDENGKEITASSSVGYFIVSN